MKNKLTERMASLKAYYKVHPKRFWVGGIVLAIVIILIATHSSAPTYTVVPVTKGDLKQTVLATGQVTSQTDLDLSFSTSDTISTLPATVGDKVVQGQVLATLDNRDQYAALSQAQASLASANAAYQKVVDGASSEEVAVAQAALDTAQSNLTSTQNAQKTLVSNAHRAFLNADLTPITSSTSVTSAPSVTGTYSDSAEGSYVITPHAAGSNGYFTYSGLESGTGNISTSTPQPLGTKGLFIQFPTDFYQHTDTVWTVMLPNTKSVQYLSAYNTYQAALQTRDSAVSAAQAQVNERQADLALKKAAARPADIGVAEANVQTAQAQVAAAQVNYDKTILRAPAPGTIVQVDTKIGERVDAQKEVIVLQDVTNLYVEANINETSIAKVALGQPVTMTLDAFGPDTMFTGAVIHVDPSATTNDGIVNYKVKASIIPPVCADATNCVDYKTAVRPGMNANISILASDTPNVITVPKAALSMANGITTVNVITNAKRGTYEKRTVTTGAEGDGNLVQVTSGLSEGDSLALLAAS